RAEPAESGTAQSKSAAAPPMAALPRDSEMQSALVRLAINPLPPGECILEALEAARASKLPVRLTIKEKTVASERAERKMHRTELKKLAVAQHREQARGRIPDSQERRTRQGSLRDLAPHFGVHHTTLRNWIVEARKLEEQDTDDAGAEDKKADGRGGHNRRVAKETIALLSTP
ncbi:MAG: hypothetical protein KGK08_14725, partial [Acidobacteriota bacterium]|nr:hypothetical protein [Acidobacteriota bacterium]